MKIAKLYLLSTGLALCLALNAQQGPSFNSLNGNWHLTGDDHGHFPRVDISMGVDGNSVYGGGIYEVCRGGGSFRIFGKVNPNGSFILSDSWGAVPSANFITVRCQITAESPDQWSGSFATLAERTPAGYCPAASVNFVAKRLPLLTGTFSGILREKQGEPQVGLIRLNITQGVLSSDGYQHYRAIPLSAKAVIEGSTEFPSGNFATAEGNPAFAGTIDGDILHLHLVAEDGSTLDINVPELFYDLAEKGSFLATVEIVSSGKSRKTGAVARLAPQEQ